MDSEAPKIEDIEIIELLGKGGMSLVYKARQKQLDRIVAVKVLSKLAAVQGEDGIKRFQKEAKLTSRLEHPNIVKTISFGVSSDGQAYLVMEYLQGLSLANELKQNGRLKLQKFRDVFLPALSALGHAHQAGLIHRDIKPGNIMLCRNDSGEETVKLVDFGIAKAFGEGENKTQQLTKSGAVMGSPAYMSPEQCQAKPLDGRSDLYSMACVMYETLSGEPPFSADSFLEVMQKHIAEPPPTVSDFSKKVEIPNELAKVTLWGLAKDPAARPQTAFEFARKLNEVLERVTLDKVPRLKKPAVAASGTLAWQSAIGASLLAAVIITVVMLQANKSQRQADDSSKRVSLTSQQKRDKFENMLKQEVKSSELTQSSGQENASALVNRALVYLRHGKSTEAELLLKRALAIDEKALGPNNPQVAEILLQLGTCYTQQNRLAEAAMLLKRSLAIRKKTFGPDNGKVAEVLIQQALCYHIQGKFTEEEPLLERSLLIVGKDEAKDQKVGIALSGLGQCYVKQGKYEKAEPLLKRALLIYEEGLGSDCQDLSDPLWQLALCYEHSGKYKDAETLLERARAIVERTRGPDCPDGLSDLADCYEHQGKHAEAEQLLKPVRAIHSRAIR